MVDSSRYRITRTLHSNYDGAHVKLERRRSNGSPRRGALTANAPPALHEGVFDPLVGSPVSTPDSARAEPALWGKTAAGGTRRAA
jgi:hypothetical protein